MGMTARVRSGQFLTSTSSKECIIVDNADLPKAVRPGDDISFNSGELRAVVLESEHDSIKVQFKQSGNLRCNSKVFIPGNRLAHLPVLQSSDKNDILATAVKDKFDYLIVPHITSVKDI